MRNELFEMETELTLMEANRLQNAFPEAVFEVFPMTKRPILRDSFRTGRLSAKAEYFLWDIIEPITHLMEQAETGADLVDIESLLPASYLLPGILSMPYWLAIEMVESDYGLLDEFTLQAILEKLVEEGLTKEQ